MRRLGALRYLLICASLLLGCIIVCTGFLVASFRERTLADTDRELRNTALIVAEQLDRSFQAIDLVQRSVLEEVAAERIQNSDDLTRLMSGGDIRQMLKDKISGLAQVDALVIVNADGQPVNSSRNRPLVTANLRERDYFRALQSDPALHHFVGAPVRNNATGAWTFFLAEKITNREGDFIGMAIGVIKLSYFEKLFGAISLGSGGTVSLYRADGTLLVRYPHPQTALGGVYTGALKALAGKKEATARFHGKINPHGLIVAAHRFDEFPLYATAARDV